MFVRYLLQRVRFARRDRDVRAFLEEIERLENDLPPGAREHQLALLPQDPDKERG